MKFREMLFSIYAHRFLTTSEVSFQKLTRTLTNRLEMVPKWLD